MHLKGGKSLSPAGGGAVGNRANMSVLFFYLQFQRLVGKRNIGKEAINMIDITADEQIGPNNHLDWKKNLTEEKEYRAKLVKNR